MRLFSKSPLSSPRGGTRETRKKKPAKSPRTSAPRQSPVQQLSPQPTSSSTGISADDDDPYPLQRVPTAHDYHSDDSDAELERTPSRYDLTMEAMDDVAMDDATNDRYGHIARRVMLADSDSVDAMWRSFSYEDEEDRNDVEKIRQRVDPLSFDREDIDWDDGEYYDEADDGSLTDFRDAPGRLNARRMNSMADEEDEEDDEEPLTAEEYSGGSSLSSILADEMDGRDRKKIAAEAEGRRKNFEAEAAEAGRRKKIEAEAAAAATAAAAAATAAAMTAAIAQKKAESAQHKKKPSLTVEVPSESFEMEEVPETMLAPNNNQDENQDAEETREATEIPRPRRKPVLPSSPTSSKGASTLERAEVVKQVVKLNEKRKKGKSPRFMRPLSSGKAAKQDKPLTENDPGSPRSFGSLFRIGQGKGTKSPKSRPSSVSQDKSTVAGRQRRANGRSSSTDHESEGANGHSSVSQDKSTVAGRQRRANGRSSSTDHESEGANGRPEEYPDELEFMPTKSFADVHEGDDDDEDNDEDGLSETNSIEDDPVLMGRTSPKGSPKGSPQGSPRSTPQGAPQGILRTATFGEDAVAASIAAAAEPEQEERHLGPVACKSHLDPAGCKAPAPPEDSGIFGFVSSLMGLNDDKAESAATKPLTMGEMKLDNPNEVPDQEPVYCDTWCPGVKREEADPQEEEEEEGSDQTAKNNQFSVQEIVKAQLAAGNPKNAKERDTVFEDRSVNGEIVAGQGGLEHEYLMQIEAKNEPVVVTCLRDNYCGGVASCIMCGIHRIDNVGCQETYGFLDEAIKAESPKRDVTDVDIANEELDAGDLLLDKNKYSGGQNNTGNRQAAGKRSKRRPKEYEQEYDVPIKTIEFPVGADSDSYSESYSTLGGRRKTVLRVDTRLEEEMRSMQDELEGKKKKSLFGRMKRRGNKTRNSDL